MSWPWNMSERKAILVGICFNFVSSICILQYNIEGKTLPSPKNKTKQKQNKWMKKATRTLIKYILFINKLLMKNSNLIKQC